MKIKCRCGGNVVIGNGSETSRQLNCQKCGDYLYYVGNMACIANSNIICTREEYNEIIQNNKLKPEIKQRIANVRKCFS